MNDDVHSYRIEPDEAFADRLERELLRRLEAPASSPMVRSAEKPFVNEASNVDLEVEEIDLEPATPRRGPSRRRLVAKLVAPGLAAATVAAIALVSWRVRDGVPADVPAENGLIAFVGTSAESGAGSDSEIYVVASDGTGLRALTSTPDVPELAPAWAPDGTRLAFLRNVRRPPDSDAGGVSAGGGELVVIDPSTGVEAFSADIPNPPNTDALPPAWSPDGRLIVLNVANLLRPLILDVETRTWTTSTTAGLFLGWSPDGKWFLFQPLSRWGTWGQPLLRVPADLLGTTDYFDRPGVRPLPVRLWDPHLRLVPWKPDSSAVAIRRDDGSTDVVTIADGRRRTLIENPDIYASWSPDGRQIAYLGKQSGACRRELRVAAADGSEARAVATSYFPPIWSPAGDLLLGQGDDGLFTVHPDGTGMTMLTPDMRLPENTCGLPREEWFGRVWQPMPPAAGAAETTPSSTTAG